MNSIFLIHPYKSGGIWVFDDPARGLKAEAFVAGADTVIDIATTLVPGAESGFNLLFADFAFPGHQIMLERMPSETGSLGLGTDYFCPQISTHAWLCPALNLYYPVSPERIYASFQPMVGRIRKNNTYNERKNKKAKRKEVHSV